MEPARTSSSGAPVLRRCGGLSVLLLDDETVFRESLAEALRDDGHVVIDVASPADVPPGQDLGDIGIVITDYEMPIEHGLSFAARFRATRPNLPVILLSTLAAELVRIGACADDLVHIFPKPMHYDELHALVHRLVG